MYCNYQSDCQYRIQDIQSPFTASYEFKPFPEPEQNLNLEKFEDENGNIDELMEQKLEIIEKRPVKGKGKKKVKPKRLPGERLMKKLHNQSQMEQSLMRVVKNIIK